MEIKLLKPKPKIYSEDKFEYLNTLFNYESYEEALVFLNDTYSLGKIANEMWYNKALISSFVYPDKNYEYLIKRVLKLKRYNSNREVLFLLYDNYLSLNEDNEFTKPFKVLDKIFKYYPDDLEAIFSKAYLLILIGDFDESLELFRFLEKKEFSKPSFYMHFGILYLFGFLDFPNAEKYFLEAHKRNPFLKEDIFILKCTLVCLMQNKNKEELNKFIGYSLMILTSEEIEKVYKHYFSNTDPIITINDLRICHITSCF